MYSNFIMSESFKLLVEANGGVNFSISTDQYDDVTVSYSMGEILVQFMFYDEYDELVISESTMVAETDLRDLVK